MGILKNLQVALGLKQEVINPVEQSAGQNPQKKILIVEDEQLLANALEAKFKHNNFNVFKAINGQIGLQMAQVNKPDIILLDLMMPVMDGKEMLHHLREIPEFKYLPVVVLTNAGDVENMKETKMYDNASAFLIKSNVNPDEILQVVNDLLK
jgi:DNA-binding response OmpR family regulator